MSVLDQGRREGDLHARVRVTENEAEELLVGGGDWSELGEMCGEQREEKNKEQMLS